jgi:hypothetical protein
MRWCLCVMHACGAADFEGVFRAMQTLGPVRYDASRELLQLYWAPGFKGPHVDVWLWRATTSSTLLSAEDAAAQHISPPHLPTHTPTLYLHTADHTIKYNPRPYTEMLPPARMWWGQGQMNVSIPADRYLLSGVTRTRGSVQ